MKRSLRIGIVWANPTSANLGVGALAWGAATLLQEVAFTKGKELEIHFFGCSVLGRRILDLPLGPLEVTLHGYYRYWGWRPIIGAILGRNPGLRKLLSMDSVLDVGEGDSFSDIYGMERFRSIVATKRLLGLARKRQVLMPQTIGPYSSEGAKKSARVAMQAMTKRFARDRLSLEAADALLGPGMVEESIDLAFALAWSKSGGGAGPRGLQSVGLNVSGLLWNGGYEGRNELGLAVDYRTLIRSLVQMLLRETGAVIVLVPHVFGQECIPAEDDRVVSEKLVTEIDDSRVSIAPEFNDPSAAKTFISKLSFFSGARMHACIAAFSSGVPVLPMAYSRKFNGLFQETLHYPWLMDLKAQGNSGAMDIARKALTEVAAMRKQIDKSLSDVVTPRLVRLREALGDAVDE